MGRLFRASFQMPGEGAIKVRRADEWSHDALLARGRFTNQNYSRARTREYLQAWA